MSVCDVAQSGKSLDGKLIRVTGVLRDAYSRVRNSYFDELVDDKCKDIEIHVGSADAAFLANVPRSYKPDVKSIQRAEAVAERAAAHGRKLSATVEGVLFVQEKDVSSAPRHKGYPFVLIIQAIRNVKEY